MLLIQLHCASCINYYVYVKGCHLDPAREAIH